MTPLNVLGIVGDRGGAEAVLPVLELLHERADRVSVISGPPSEALVGGSPVTRIIVDGDIDTARAVTILAADRPDAVVTGTSWGDRRLEGPFIDAARQLGIPSLAVLDFWSNYRMRFEMDGRMVLPDGIAVMDEAARRGAEADGLPADRIVVTGNPHLERVAERYRGFDREARLAFRERVGVSRRTTMLLFVSQPIAALYGPSLGYTGRGVLALVRQGAAAVAEWLGHDLLLAVRPHPRDTALALPTAIPGVAVREAASGDALEWSLASDLVLGMTSAVLVQAALLGARTLSIQPGRPAAPDWPLAMAPVTDPGSVARELYRALSRPAHGRGLRPRAVADSMLRGAAQRVVDCLERLAEGVAA